VSRHVRERTAKSKFKFCEEGLCRYFAFLRRCGHEADGGDQCEFPGSV